MITDLGHPAFAARDVDETIGFYGKLHHDDGPLIEPGQEVRSPSPTKRENSKRRTSKSDGADT
jgi:hypothetical protein